MSLDMRKTVVVKNQHDKANETEPLSTECNLNVSNMIGNVLKMKFSVGRLVRNSCKKLLKHPRTFHLFRTHQAQGNEPSPIFLKEGYYPLGPELLLNLKILIINKYIYIEIN